MFRDAMGVALKDLIESKGPVGAQRVVHLALKQKKIQPERFSIREIWEACQAAEGQSVNISEAVVSDSFPKITGELISAKIIAAYDLAATVGDRFVTNNPGVKQKVDTIVGFVATEGPDEVAESHPYNDSTIGEKYVTIQSKKFGRIISITEEMIYFDQTGQILNRANTIGDNAAQYKEKLIMEGVQDVNSNVYNPSGVATAFYSAANGNLASSNPFDEAGLEAVRKLMHTQRNDAPNTDANYIMINDANCICLVPVDLEVEAWQMANSTLTPESAENAANFFRNRFTPVTSPYVTARSTTTWYYGEFNKDFWWNEIWPLQTMAAKPGNSDEFNRDIKAKIKVRFFGNVGAVDTKHSYKSTV